MIAITLFAFAWSSPRLSRMSLSNFCASFDRTAAGRACRPVGFGMTTASEVTVRPVGTATPSTAPSRSPPPNVGLRDVVDPAVTRPARGVNDVRMSELAMTTWVSRLFALVATLSRSKLMSSSPARTRSPIFDLRREALAAHLHGVQADVDQHLEIAEGADGDGVPGRVKVDDLAVARGEKVVAEGVDRDALADHLLGEDGVGHLLDRHDDARQRGLQVKTRDGRCGDVRRHGVPPQVHRRSVRQSTCVEQIRC